MHAHVHVRVHTHAKIISGYLGIFFEGSLGYMISCLKSKQNNKNDKQLTVALRGLGSVGVCHALQSQTLLGLHGSPGFLGSCDPLCCCSPGRHSSLGQIQGQGFIYRFPTF